MCGYRWGWRCGCGWMDGRIGRWMDGRIARSMGGQTDGWLDRHGSIYGSTIRWTYREMNIYGLTHGQNGQMGM